MNKIYGDNIYIPIWLDLLYITEKKIILLYAYLHSNMVRFIIKDSERLYNESNNIYIPIWLDLL